MSVGTPPSLANPTRARLKSVGPNAYQVRGLFSGNINLGCLYLRLYPERRSEGNPIQTIQRTLGARETDIYLIGLYNLMDDLSAAEAADLDCLISRWWDIPLPQIRPVELVLMITLDDLALDSAIVDRIPL